ncbi:28S ribosomal protein S18b, mitochondrial-like isoform X2 [Xenia sp. Carnegie-2017]|nr:28S ribosomal protein S18b, mitochondrial-like isoform X2 [Xenia sp. Carnegie-2017]XP_046845910.1 28S ribosomal protein S18b, mitochondrial-like isoform X2 [Xenia sp. Carnegie-2017]
MMKNVQKKTGVIVKLQKREHGILIGGTRQEVQQAVLNIKSSMKQDGQDKSNLVTQDSEFERTGFTKEKPIWAYYRRNFKGQKPPMKTRKKCIRGKGNSQKVSGNPCPICRLYLAGEYELDYKDVDLLEQFISPHTGEIFDSAKTGVCRHQQKNLIDVIQTAKNYGLLHYTIPGPRSIQKPIQHAKIPVNVRLK